jgi:hypothetical protein
LGDLRGRLCGLRPDEFYVLRVAYRPLCGPYPGKERSHAFGSWAVSASEGAGKLSPVNSRRADGCASAAEGGCWLSSSATQLSSAAHSPTDRAHTVSTKPGYPQHTTTPAPQLHPHETTAPTHTAELRYRHKPGVTRLRRSPDLRPECAREMPRR